MKKKGFIDALAFAGYKMEDDDEIMIILAGLGHEYDSLVIPLTSMQTHYMIPEVSSLLLNHEARLEQHNRLIH